MALKTLTKFLVGSFFILGSSTAIDGDGTCKHSGACVGGMTGKAAAGFRDVLARLADIKNRVQPNEDTSALFQSKKAQVPAARALQTNDPNTAAEQIEASRRPRMQKLTEMKAAVHNIKDLIGAGSTPEVKGLIQELITIIETDLQEKIKRDQTNAQTELDTRLGKLGTTTKIAVLLKAGVDRIDESHEQCVTKEHQLLEGYETCKAEEATLMKAKPSARFCGHPDFDISYSEPPQLPPVLTVDFSEGLTHVQAQLDQYLVPLKMWIDAMKSQAATDQEKWDAADQRCREISDKLDDKTIECGRRLDTWRAQHENCLNVKNVQKLSLCEFGKTYHNKCAAKSEVDELKVDIVGHDTVWSEPDRENEWTETTKLTCVLAKFKITTDLNSGAVDDCTKSDAKAAAEFDQDCTRIDMKQATYDGLTSTAKLTCAETYLKFGGGVLWTVPVNDAGVVGWIPKSASYTKATGHTYAIDSGSILPPYDLHCTPDACICLEMYDPKCYKGVTFLNMCQLECKVPEPEKQHIVDGECNACICTKNVDPQCYKGETFSNRCTLKCQFPEADDTLIVQGECSIMVTG